LTSRLQSDLYPTTARQYAYFQQSCGTFVNATGLRAWEELEPLVPAAPAGKIRAALELVHEAMPQYIAGNIRKLRSASEAVRREGLAVVGHLRPERLLAHIDDLVRCLEREGDVQAAALAILGQFGAAAVPALCNGLSSPKTGCRLACIQALAALGAAAQDAVPQLQRVISSQGGREIVKGAAREALALIDQPTATVIDLIGS
jgi:HEAT repeat protein